MLRLSVRDEEFLMIGDDVKIVFLGSSGGQTRIMIDAPKEVNIVRSKAIEKRIQDPELLATILMVTHDAFTASYAGRVIFIKDGKIFNEIRRGESTRKEFFDKIIDVVTLLGGDLNNAL